MNHGPDHAHALGVLVDVDLAHLNAPVAVPLADPAVAPLANLAVDPLASLEVDQEANQGLVLPVDPDQGHLLVAVPVDRPHPAQDLDREASRGADHHGTEIIDKYALRQLTFGFFGSSISQPIIGSDCLAICLSIIRFIWSENTSSQ